MPRRIFITRQMIRIILVLTLAFTSLEARKIHRHRALRRLGIDLKYIGNTFTDHQTETRFEVKGKLSNKVDFFYGESHRGKAVALMLYDGSDMTRTEEREMKAEVSELQRKERLQSYFIDGSMHVIVQDWYVGEYKIRSNIDTSNVAHTIHSGASPGPDGELYEIHIYKREADWNSAKHVKEEKKRFKDEAGNGVIVLEYWIRPKQPCVTDQWGSGDDFERVKVSASETSVMLPGKKFQFPANRDYKVRGYLGAGGFGDVYVAESIEKKPVAIKLFKPRGGKAKHYFQDEVIAFMKVMGMKRVAQMIDFFEQKPTTDPGSVNPNDAVHSYVVVVEYYNLGDLENVLFRLNDAATKQLKDGDYSDTILCDILELLIKTEEGLRDMHAKLLSHSDVKPQNILVKGRTGTIEEGKDARNILDPEEMTVAVGDLGFVDEANKEGSENFKKLQHSLIPRLKSFGKPWGSVYYMPPEKKASYPVSSKDVYAFGKLIQGDIIETMQPINAENERKMDNGQTYSTKRSAYDVLTTAGDYYKHSYCADILRRIPGRLALHKLPWHRATDDMLLTYMKNGLEKGRKISNCWTKMINHGAVGLNNVKKTSPGILGVTRSRWMFFTPYLDETGFGKYVFKCPGTLVEHKPYIVISSEKENLMFRCIPIESVKASSDGTTFTIKSTDASEKQYKMDLKDSNCNDLPGTCKTLTGSGRSSTFSKTWTTHVVKLLQGDTMVDENQHQNPRDSTASAFNGNPVRDNYADVLGDTSFQTVNSQELESRQSSSSGDSTYTANSKDPDFIRIAPSHDENGPYKMFRDKEGSSSGDSTNTAK